MDPCSLWQVIWGLPIGISHIMEVMNSTPNPKHYMQYGFLVGFPPFTLNPGTGFPLISGQVAVVELEGSRPSTPTTDELKQRIPVNYSTHWW